MPCFAPRRRTMTITSLLNVSGLLLCALTGVVTSYFPGVHEQDTDLGVLCQQAQVYTAGGQAAVHGVEHITVKPSMSSYIPRKKMQVSVISVETPFAGVILQARKLGSSKSYGTFSLSSETSEATDSLRNCDSKEDTVFLWLPDGDSTNVTVNWTPPKDDVGTLQFAAIVFKRDGTFWPNLTSNVFSQGFAPIDVDTCGEEKGCFRYSRTDPSCNEDTCEYLFTYVVKGPEVHFEMVSNLQWVAVGFSSDDMMGGDDVFMCVKLNSGPDVRHYWTEYQHNTPVLKEKNPLYNREATIGDDGRIKCRFSRQLKIYNDQHSVDLNNDWYQLYAWGVVSGSGNSIMRHRLESPPTSSRKVTLFRKLNVIGAATPLTSASCYLLAFASLLTAVLFKA